MAATSPKSFGEFVSSDVCMPDNAFRLHAPDAQAAVYLLCSLVVLAHCLPLRR